MPEKTAQQTYKDLFRARRDGNVLCRNDERDAVRTNDGLAWNSPGPGASPSDLEETDYSVVADYRRPPRWQNLRSCRAGCVASTGVPQSPL